MSEPSKPVLSSSSKPGTGAERVTTLLRLYARMILQPLDIMLLDALLVGPFGFGKKEGGATAMQLSRFLGLAPKMIFEAFKGGPLGPRSGIIITSASFKDDQKNDSSDDSEDNDADETGDGDLRVGVRRLMRIRYYINFAVAVPYAIAHISKAFMALLKRPSDGSLELEEPSTARSANVGGGEGGGARRWHCFTCKHWLPQVPTKSVVATCYCSVCGGNLLFMAAAEARACFESARAARAAAGPTPTPQTPVSATPKPAAGDPTKSFTLPQKWLRVLYRDPPLLQQLSAYAFLLSCPLKCTALTPVAFSPTDWVTADEAALMQGHATLGGLVSMGTANLFRLHQSQRANSSTLPIRFNFGSEMEAAATAQNAMKVAKRHTLPPWMVPQDLKGLGDSSGKENKGALTVPSSESDALGSTLARKRPREEEGARAADAIVSGIARSALTEKYFIIDL